MTQSSNNRSIKVSVFMVLCVIALAIAPACKFNCSMGGSTVEDTIVEQLKLTSVTCPDYEAKAGATFKCTGNDADGKSRSVTVTFTDDKKFDAFIDS